MAETVKKISRKIRGVSEAELLIGDIEDEPFKAELKNVEFKITRNYVDIEKTEPIVCPSCGAKHSKKWIRRKVDTIGLTRRISLVDKKGKHNQRLIEFYAKVKKGKMSPREFFNGEHRIKRMYADIPIEERPMSSTSQSVAITCKNCDYKLGLIEVSAEATPERPLPPDIDTIIHLPRTPLEDRWMREEFHITEANLDEWLAGKDKETVDKMEELTEFEKKVRDFPITRETAKETHNLTSAVHLAIEKMQQEIQSRKVRLYNLFAAPPDIINAQIARIQKMRIENELLTDEQKKTEFRKIPGLDHVSSELVQNMIERGKLFPGHGVKPKEKTEFEKEMEKLGAKKLPRR